MLQIKGISKVYKTGSLVQQALDRVSLSLRDNEFVAILGQSGSGKTTLLNVIGGLDRYDEGDLIINGVSTKKYNHRDWDAYRNHSVGFVFQSYNLIPHQTILANVELALTISGISKRERKKRARRALERVGLKEHMHKKPSQLSGGQMQRVAIARALVNNPDILLADEPTGALDSETSLQVMELLKEVASDRLVVMVTHNPELAEKYATRIVQLKDGTIRSDSDPFEPESGGDGVHRRLGKASMSFFTSLGLSFNNLWTKKVRTLLVSFAGSIGIIGIAAILSMSTGADRYIQSVQEDTLKSYPLQITDTAFNLANFMVPRQEEAEEEQKNKPVREWRTVTNLFSRVSTNNLTALRAYLESGQTDVYNYVQAIEYGYNITPQIFSLSDGEVRQVNPDRSFAALGFSATDSMNGLFSTFSNTDTFHAMPSEKKLYLGQYDLMAGRWPENELECLVVLTKNGRVPDLTLYTLGLKDPEELAQMVRAFKDGVATEIDETERRYNYEDFLGIRFRLLCATDFYEYDSDYKVWTDRSSDQRYLKQLVENAEELTIVGVVRPQEDSATPSLQTGIVYPAALVTHLMELAEQSEIVQSQLAQPELDVFTGKPFGETAEQDEFDMASLFSIDEDALKQAFGFDAGDGFDLSSLDLSRLELPSMDLSGFDLSSLPLDFGDLGASLPAPDREMLTELFQGIELNVTQEELDELFTTLLNGFLEYAAQDPSTDFARLPDAAESYLRSGAVAPVLDSLRELLEQKTVQIPDPTEDLQEMVGQILDHYPAYLTEIGVSTEDGIPYDYLSEYLQSERTLAVMRQTAQALREKVVLPSLTQEELLALTQELTGSYSAYASENSLPDPALLRGAFTEYLASEQVQTLLAESALGMLNTEKLEQSMSSMIAGYSEAVGAQIAAAVKKTAGTLAKRLSGALTGQITKMMAGLSEQLQSSFGAAFSADPEAIAAAFRMNFDPAQLRDLMTSLMSTQESSSDNNLHKLGYADLEKPSSITIYPVDFAGKTEIKTILEQYNHMQEAAGEDEKVISYTDIVDTLMSSVTDIIDAISVILIAFVAVSLVVSSVMIGVITYISVLERKKEIGILRAIGASKRNISQVFNAETFIIGALAGVLGVGITYLLLIPANKLIHNLAGQVDINAVLPVPAALALIALSIVLTLIGGIIPSRKAARSDPVAALRSE